MVRDSETNPPNATSEVPLSAPPRPGRVPLDDGFLRMLGFIAAALVPGSILGLALAFMEAVREAAFQPLEVVNLALVGSIFGLGYTIPAILIAGLPLCFLYLRLGWSDLPRHLAGGAAIGWALAVVTGSKHGCSRQGLAANLPDWLACLSLGEQLLLSGMGAVAALMFWSIAYRRRPWLVFIGLHAALPLAILALR